VQNIQREAALLALKMAVGPYAKECGHLLEAGKGKEMNSSLEPPDRHTALLTP
jgi:hypothetical protein